MPAECLAPTPVIPALTDPDLVRRLAEADAPHFPVQRYTSSPEEAASIGDHNSAAAGRLIIAPNFRGDWAAGGQALVAGADALLHHDGFIEAAATMWQAEIVRPVLVYANFTYQLPFPQGGGHIDVPAFRGFDRRTNPIWLLLAMGHSGLFSEFQIDIATAVAWFWTGDDGGLEYWPDGPNAPSMVHEGDIDNTALVGDNDRMFHRVRPVGALVDGMPTGLSLDSALVHDVGTDWRIVADVDSDATIAAMDWSHLRVSVSWKAYVFADADAQRRADEAIDPLTIDVVVERFRADLAERGIDVAPPTDPRRDPSWVTTLATTYVTEPDPLVF